MIIKSFIAFKALVLFLPQLIITNFPPHFLFFLPLLIKITFLSYLYELFFHAFNFELNRDDFGTADFEQYQMDEG